jgi:hypothetical protein
MREEEGLLDRPQYCEEHAGEIYTENGPGNIDRDGREWAPRESQEGKCHRRMGGGGKRHGSLASGGGGGHAWRTRVSATTGASYGR